MIHVDEEDEPADFDERVRQPGLQFLQEVPHPKGKQWKRSKQFWRRMLKELHEAYDGICAYSCHWIPQDTGARTVEHFLPKDDHPDQAYEWSNYRLVCSTLNGRKGTRTIVDPFVIPDGLFEIKFPSLLVIVPEGIEDPALRQALNNTRLWLGLNDEGTCLANRTHYVDEYCAGHVDFIHLQRHAPFLAREIERQGLTEAIKEMWTA